MKKTYSNILETIGNTPMVKINNLNPNKKIAIYAKLEGQNPGGSIKDRIALGMIEAAENSGELNKDKVIIEATSGNTGIGLALVSAVKGYRLILTMSSGMSMERKKMLKSFGAELIETDPSLGTDGAIMKAKDICKKNPQKYWMPNQFNNLDNPLAHYNNTAEEIIQQMSEITMFIAGMGTSGTLMGVGKRLKEYNSDISIVGIEPQLNHKIAGLKNMKEAIVPEIYDEGRLDRKIVISNEDAYATARELAKKEGIFVGMSSGGAMFGAIQIAKQMNSGNIVTVFPDRGEKYLSTALYS
ncbi:PLP-dependent cysteine synthase family protein [Candidatus Peregrinibacteria bacterium]|jgi:cysteine synthase|nr:PLP-dependent cysteine synthase family protein [Candidatus Peregrinibacteria bacterium]MBT4366130.1 PLP-dependent cysteine synthase family protein [Candidatus Peregrinibacteria bacterium]MBT4456212.1 PLP-dependent cysteine synthase family protein [Candidatus Peregrinibacteria bacterium]